MGAHRPLRVRHDDADRAGHVGGGARAPSTPRSPPPTWCSTARRPRTPAAARPATTSPARAYGGCCYLNNAAIAAARLRAALGGPVAVLDIDAHHGNGTQAIFYDRADVLHRLGPRRPRRGLVPPLPRLRGRGRRRRRARARTATSPLAPGTGDDGWVAGGAGARRLGARRRAAALVVALGVDAAAGDPESPLRGHRRRLPRGRPRARRARPADRRRAGGRLRPRHDRRARARRAGGHRGGTTRRRGWLSRWRTGSARTRPRASRSSRARTSSRRRTGGSRRSRATERPRSLALGADRRHAVFIQDRDTSDVWLLDLDDAGAPPQRLTTGREPTPYWEDTEPRLSPDGTQVAYADEGHVWLVAAAGGPPRKLLEAGAPGLARRRARCSSRSSAATPRGSPSSTSPTHGRAGSRPPRRARRARRRVGRRRLARRHRGRLRVHARAPTSTARRSASPTSPPARCARSPARRGCRTARPPGRPTARRSPTSPSAPARWALHTVGARRERRAAAHHRRGGLRRAAVASGRRPHRGHARRAQPLRPRRPSTPARGAVDGARARRRVGRAALDRGGRADRHLRGPRDPARAARSSRGGARRARCSRPRRSPSAARRTSAPEDVTFRSRDGLEIPGFLFRPRDASPTRPVPAIVYPHGGPTDAYRRRLGRPRAVLRRQGLRAGWPSTSAARPATGATSSARNHGVWGVEDTWDCLAAADHLRTLDWVDGDRLGIFGASYGSYMALLSVTDDPEHRFRCAVAKYGDCDILTSWAQGDRDGRAGSRADDGPPGGRRAAYRAGSPVHRLENIAGAAAHRPRRARRAREPEAVRGAGRRRCAGSARRSST